KAADCKSAIPGSNPGGASSLSTRLTPALLDSTPDIFWGSGIFLSALFFGSFLSPALTDHGNCSACPACERLDRRSRPPASHGSANARFDFKKTLRRRARLATLLDGEAGHVGQHRFDKVTHFGM